MQLAGGVRCPRRAFRRPTSGLKSTICMFRSLSCSVDSQAQLAAATLATERGAVSWTRVLLYGAALGSIVPFLMAVVLVCVALRDGRKYGVLSAVQECLAMLVLGLVCGIAIAITFRLIVGSPKAVP